MLWPAVCPTRDQRPATDLPPTPQRGDSSMLAIVDNASSSSSSEVKPGWPLLYLPGPAQQALVAQLAVGERRSLRLACKAASSLVDRWTTQLRISQEALLAGGTALQQRYATVARLVLSAGHNYRIASGPQPPQLLHLAPWPAISAVTVNSGHLRGALQLLTSFPCIKDCCLQRVALPGANETAFTAAEFSSLPASLTSVAWVHAEGRLSSQQLDTLASVPVLTRLEAWLTEPGPSSRAALACMVALRSMSVAYSDPEPTAVDLRGLTVLTYLRWRGLSELQLPISFVQLDVLHLPPAAVLPCLTSLVLCTQPLKQQLLVALAAGCPVLGKLQVENVFLTTTRHPAQLTALTQLSVMNLYSSSGGVQLSSVFPRLQVLRLRSISSNGAGPLASLEGLASLERLDVGRDGEPVQLLLVDFEEDEYDDIQRVRLQLHDFELLAQLPALSCLRLDMTAQHVAGMALLSQLRRVEWVWNCSDAAPQASGVLDRLCASLHSARPHVQLRSAAVCWLEGSPSSFDLLGGVMDAAVSWLVRAPALVEVQWIGSADSHRSMLTEQRLSALAASSSIRRFVVSCSASGEGFGQPDFVLHDVAGSMLASRGVEVVVQAAEN